MARRTRPAGSAPEYTVGGLAARSASGVIADTTAETFLRCASGRSLSFISPRATAWASGYNPCGRFIGSPPSRSASRGSQEVVDVDVPDVGSLSLASDVEREQVRACGRQVGIAPRDRADEPPVDVDEDGAILHAESQLDHDVGGHG